MSYKTHLKFWTSRFLHSFTNFFIYRGFFCDDENLRHPYVEELISTHACAAIWIAAVLFLVFFFSKMVFCFSKLFWPTVRKNGSIDWEKLLKFKAEGRELDIFFWDHYNDLFEQWKVSTIFEREYLLNLFLEVSQI